MKILLKNVRSFCNRHSIPLRPLTFLVGENSTGKSTFLATLAQLSQPEFPTVRPAFNVPPFDLGTFDSIATFKGGRYGRADSFSVGFETEKHSVEATYISHKGQPQLSRYANETDKGKLSLTITDDGSSLVLKADPIVGKAKEFKLDLTKMLLRDATLSVQLLSRFALTQGEGSGKFSERVFELAVGSPRQLLLPILALAPIRTKPRRTYDEFSDEFRPEGDHIPVLLARLWQEEGSSRKSHLLRALQEFGENSGLFKQVGVKRLGKRPSDPFQILITTAGPPANLPDVGYGVSQVLPLVVQCVLAEGRRRLLLQQPEVHLHPKAQAALGSFLSKLVKEGQTEFVVETHSDFLLDRVRLEIAQGVLKPNDVLILFFEKEGLETEVHQIHIDELGNIVGAPASYRDFFLQEELTLFSRTVKPE